MSKNIKFNSITFNIINIDTFIKNHNHYNYCDAIILPNGDITYACPGHIYALLNIANISQKEYINNSNISLKLLCMYTKCILVTYDYIIAMNVITPQQEKSLNKLIESNCISKDVDLVNDLKNNISNTEIYNYINYTYKPTNNIHNFYIWGSDKYTNILYIGGISGAGKSILATELSDYYNSYVIYLDAYFEFKNHSIFVTNAQNKEFNLFCKNNDFDITILQNEDLFNNNKKEYFKYVDKFAKLIESFGENVFDKSYKVIVEGIQLRDETLYPDKAYFNNKPYILIEHKFN